MFVIELLALLPTELFPIPFLFSLTDSLHATVQYMIINKLSQLQKKTTYIALIIFFSLLSFYLIEFLITYGGGVSASSIVEIS
jgi:hypothetical protein